MEKDKITTTDNTQISAAKDNFYKEAFKTFFKIGASTLNGRHTQLQIIQEEIVEKRKWIPQEEFTDIVAIAQSCPGIFTVNISLLIGFKLRKAPGAICTCLGTVLPSFLIILAITLFFHQFMDVPWIAAIFRGVRPAVVALIAVPTFMLAKESHITLSNCWIPIITAILIWLLGVNPVFVIIAAVIGGYLYGKFIKPTE